MSLYNIANDWTDERGNTRVMAYDMEDQDEDEAEDQDEEEEEDEEEED